MTIRHWTNHLSRVFGKFANTAFPGPVQRCVNSAYTSLMDVDLSEFDTAGSYKTLNALFTRELVKKRAFDGSAETFIAPADSLITEQGGLERDRLLQIKGMDYSMRDLLTEAAGHVDDMLDGDFVNFYLSPRDYHRYHAPAAFDLRKLIHVPGRLYPVNMPSLKKRKNLFVTNERVILECGHDAGSVFYLAFIAATNVGDMLFECEPRVETNTNSVSVSVYEYEAKRINKGDCLGCFKMGSSVVMVLQKDFLELRTTLNQKVRFGDIVGQVRNGTTLDR